MTPVPKDPVSRYFRRVYPVLRGAGGLNPGTRLTRRFTEPGQEDRLAWVLHELDGCRPVRILDVGCGQGTYALALARLGHDVTGVDFSAPMLQAARRAAGVAPPVGRLRYVFADARDWVPPGRYDVVLCIGVAEYYADVGGLLRRVCGWADQLALFTMSRAGAGPRNVVRQAWLGLHGLRSGFYRAPEIATMLADLPDAEVEVEQKRWTHCVAVRRLRVSAVAPRAAFAAASRAASIEGDIP